MRHSFDRQFYQPMQTKHSFDRQFYQPISSCKRDTPSTASFISQSARANETLLRPPVLSANQLVQTGHSFDRQFYQPISSCKRDTPSTASLLRPLRPFRTISIHPWTLAGTRSGAERVRKAYHVVLVTKNVGTPTLFYYLSSCNSSTWASPLLRRALCHWLSGRKLSLSLTDDTETDI